MPFRNLYQWIPQSLNSFLAISRTSDIRNHTFYLLASPFTSTSLAYLLEEWFLR